MKEAKIREAVKAAAEGAKATAEALGKLEEALELEDEQDSENARLQEELNASQAENARLQEELNASQAEKVRSTSRSVSRTSADGPKAKAQEGEPLWEAEGYPSAFMATKMKQHPL